jgi:inhibitor of KinA sporulation pathway (predicted exonuclease)
MEITKYLVIDVEATCDDKNAVPRDQMEIIEFGAVLCDAETLKPLGEFQSFVRPVRHPTLTPFCRQLTGITQAQVDAAPKLPDALAALTRELFGPGVVFCSWGNYDRNQIRQDCAYHRVPYPFGPDHINLKQQFSEARRLPRELGMAAALREVGLRLQGAHHRGIDDARNIARLLPYLAE